MTERCSPEKPCAELDRAHLALWGECFRADRRDIVVRIEQAIAENDASCLPSLCLDYPRALSPDEFAELRSRFLAAAGDHRVQVLGPLRPARDPKRGRLSRFFERWIR